MLTLRTRRLVRPCFNGKYRGRTCIFYLKDTKQNRKKNYTVTDKECLAVVWAVKQFRPHLFNDFIVKTGNMALK